ncbi:hypothetical protein [Bacillus sp. AFS040349]|nr:hypothetical protein [Bacillus sp. AFS040349]
MAVFATVFGVATSLGFWGCSNKRRCFLFI